MAFPPATAFTDQFTVLIRGTCHRCGHLVHVPQANIRGRCRQSNRNGRRWRIFCARTVACATTNLNREQDQQQTAICAAQVVLHELPKLARAIAPLSRLPALQTTGRKSKKSAGPKKDFGDVCGGLSVNFAATAKIVATGRKGEPHAQITRWPVIHHSPVPLNPNETKGFMSCLTWQTHCTTVI
jgi:hypothetical protein